jgi:hypothetical protein
VEAFVEYNDASPEMVVLDKLKESLILGDVALQNIWAEVACADKVLEITAMAPKSRVSDGMPAAMKDILTDVAGYLRSVQSVQQKSKKQLESLGLVVRSLVQHPPFYFLDKSHTDLFLVLQLRAKSISEKANKKRQVEGETMIDTIQFLKECLDNHARLVDIILGRPEPLVQQGTDLMQAILSEMFGLSAPNVREFSEPPAQGVVEDLLEESEVESESEQQSDSDTLEETIHTQSLMDLGADESSGPDSDAYHEDSASEYSE